MIEFYLVGKIVRLAILLETGQWNHESIYDTLDDISVYAQMIKQILLENKLEEE